LLREMILNECGITELPEELCSLSKLELLVLGRNELSQMPQCLSEMRNLKTLILTGNPISDEEKKRIVAALPDATVIF
jgi:leucine-rich repeat protein SHOC2